jgi:hypothetical protein
MSIYTLTEEDLSVFESLKKFPFNEDDFGPWEIHYKKYIHPRYGISHTDETKHLMSEAWKHRTISNNTKKKMSNAKIGENNPMFGKKRPETSEMMKTRNPACIKVYCKFCKKETNLTGLSRFHKDCS